MKRDMAVVTAYRRPLGYLQISAAQLAAAITLKDAITAWNAANPTRAITIPQGVYIGYAMIQNNVASTSIRWTDDASVPTSTVGMVLGNAELDYAGDMYAIQFILQTGSPILDIALYE